MSGFYGNVIQSLKDNFFSRIKFQNEKLNESTGEKEEILFEAESANDTVTFEAGEGLAFDTSGPDNEIILKHDKPWGQDLKPVLLSGPGYPISFDISKDEPDRQSISFDFKMYDEFGHVHEDSHQTHYFNLNIETEKQKRQEVANEVSKYDDLIAANPSDENIYDLMKKEINAQVLNKTLQDFYIAGVYDTEGILTLTTKKKEGKRSK